MSSDWVITKLSEIGSFERGKSKHRPRDAAHLYGGAYPFIQTGDITASNGKITDFRQTYSEAGLNQSRLWPANTLCITIAANIAETALLTFPACFPDSVVGYSANPEKADVRFIEYLFRAFRQEIKNKAYGSVQENINLETLRGLSFPVPSLQTQHEIADVLMLFDDRITLLRETNKTLESIAQAIFKSWFVDFDPVRAKMEGRQPEGMDEETAALFPDSFEESDLGLIPKGWATAPFYDTIQIIGGGTPKTSNPDYWEGSIPWYSVVDAPTETDVFVIDTAKKITKAGLEGSSTKLLPQGTTIISARGTVGKLALTGCEMAMNQSCYGLRGLHNESYFTYFSTKRLVDRLKQQAHGSVFDTITQATFKSIITVKPPLQIMLQYEKSIKNVMERILTNLVSTSALAELRDTLLPRLISGQLRLPEAQKQVEDALT